VIDAVVFDMDGVIVDSEQVWDDVREQYTRESGGTYTAAATRDMMGMSSVEWSRYMHEALGVPGTPEEINAEVVRRMLERYGEAPPLIPGAVEAVRECASQWPLAVASSSNPELIEVVLERAGIRGLFRAVVSSQEVPRGKPARCAAVEDSHNGIRSAKSAGMAVVAVPNAHFPPDPESVALADAVVQSVDAVPETIRGLNDVE
jgi:beta-phosphoglucomutase-like phosphatase (HAD superfamily)